MLSGDTFQGIGRPFICPHQPPGYYREKDNNAKADPKEDDKSKKRKEISHRIFRFDTPNQKKAAFILALNRNNKEPGTTWRFNKPKTTRSG
jgi:hypothetical protein